jgi:hypothetical protein
MRCGIDIKCEIPLGRFLWGLAIAQISQLRQTPTGNFVKPIIKTPTNPATKPVTLANNGIETLRVNPVAIAQHPIEIAQPTQLRQTPTQTTTKPVNKTPSLSLWSNAS